MEEVMLELGSQLNMSFSNGRRGVMVVLQAQE